MIHVLVVFALLFSIAFAAGAIGVWWQYVKPLGRRLLALEDKILEQHRAIGYNRTEYLKAQERAAWWQLIAEQRHRHLLTLANRLEHATGHGVRSMTVEQLLDEAGVQ